VIARTDLQGLPSVGKTSLASERGRLAASRQDFAHGWAKWQCRGQAGIGSPGGQGPSAEEAESEPGCRAELSKRNSRRSS
jgi:hypothetical protein